MGVRVRYLQFKKTDKPGLIVPTCNSFGKLRQEDCWESEKRLADIQGPFCPQNTTEEIKKTTKLFWASNMAQQVKVLAIDSPQLLSYGLGWLASKICGSVCLYYPSPGAEITGT